MKVNGHFYRHFRAPRDGGALFKVHLGPGQKNYIDGWVNVDANRFTAKCDIWANLLNPLPFHDGTVDAMYSHHVVEHLPRLEFHFQDVFRCLKPGGKYRVGGPNGDAAMRKFIAEDKEWFSDFPDNRSSIGGRFENFIFCRKEHLTILTFSFLEEIMSKVGFAKITRRLPVKETCDPDVFLDCLARENEIDYEFPHTLIVEAERPPSNA